MNEIKFYRTANEFIKIINIIYFALLWGILIFSAVGIYIGISESIPTAPDFENILLITAVLISIVSILSGRIIFNRKISSLPLDAKLKEKISSYNTFKVIKFATIEGSAFLNIVAYMLTGKFIFLIILGIILLVFLMEKPSLENFMMTFNLSSEERAKIESNSQLE